MNPLRQLPVKNFLPLLLAATTFTVAQGYATDRFCAHTAATDTIQPRSGVDPSARQAQAPVTLPGTRLDTNFRMFPAPNPAIGKAAPAWLRAEVSGTPTYVIDGKAATAKQLRTLRRSEVASVSKLEGTKAARLYGKNARHGLVLITMKPGSKPRQ